MRKICLKIFIFIIISLLGSGFNLQSDDYIQTDKIERMFRQVLPDDIIYTKVPRGLIVSIRSKYFFDGCNKNLKPSAYQILDKIITILKTIPNDCVIESHIGYTDCTKDITNWELSMIRSSNIADYLFCKEIPTNRIFDIGFGKNMPFEKNVYPQNKKSDDRVDFVIINYEAKR